MPRRPAKVTQADIARALRAAKQAGASAITVDAEGTIRIALMNEDELTSPIEDPEQEWAPSEALRHYLKRAESS